MAGMPLVRDEAADSLYVFLVDLPVEHCEALDERRSIEYGADGIVVGVRFAAVSRGVRLDGLPSRRKVEAVLRASPNIMGLLRSSR